ncbi:EAL and HDOD domain-containing protein [Candidatus Latescibacterota bacterium]
MLDSFIARQPIFDQMLTVIGYDLLYSSYDADNQIFVDDEVSSSHLIVDTFMDIGFEQLVDDKLAFIRLSHNFLLKRPHLPLPQNAVVIEVFCNNPMDKELIAAIRHLSESGYQVALDNVVNPDHTAPLAGIAHIVKVNIAEVDINKLKFLCWGFKKQRFKMSADWVTSHDVLDQCRSLGFEYFQGDFLTKPNVVRGHSMPEVSTTLIRLLSKLQSSKTEFSELEEIISQDVSLSYKFLRLINSSFYSFPRKIGSIRQGLTLLGMKEIRNWTSLLYILRVGDKPHELMIMALFRAKMCELIMEAAKDPLAESAFTVGLFSVLDALMDIPMEEVVALLPLSDEISAALVRREGALGAALQCVFASGMGKWEEIKYPDLGIGAIKKAYLESIDWTRSLSKILIA